MKKGLLAFLALIVIIAATASGCGSVGRADQSPPESVAPQYDEDYNVSSDNGGEYGGDGSSESSELAEEDDYIVCPACNGEKQQICTWCNGTGHLEVMGEQFDCITCNNTGYRDCFRCSGKGVIHNPDKPTDGYITVNPGIYDPDLYNPDIGGNFNTHTTCPRCGGTGTVTCSMCKGTGATQKMIDVPNYGYGGGGTRMIDQRCISCSGTGRVNCISCLGKGFI